MHITKLFRLLIRSEKLKGCLKCEAIQKRKKTTKKASEATSARSFSVHRTKPLKKAPLSEHIFEKQSIKS